MRFRYYVLLILLLNPASALAARAPNSDVVTLLMLVSLCVLLTPAFLVPFAGVLTLQPELSKTRPVVFAAYAIFGTALFLASILSPVTTLPATSLLALAVLTITAPSFYYFFVAYRTARERSEDA